MIRRHVVFALLTVAAAGACTPAQQVATTTASTFAPPATTTTLANNPPATTTSTAAPLQDCRPSITDLPPIDESDLATASLTLSRAWYDCAERVVVVGSTAGLELIALASQLASAQQAVLLVAGDSVDLVEEIDRLAPTEITTIEFTLNYPGSVTDSLAGNTLEIADQIRRRIGAIARVGVEAASVDIAASVVAASPHERTVIAPLVRPGSCEGPDAQHAIGTAAGSATPGPTFLVDSCSPGLAMLLRPALSDHGNVMLADRSSPWTSATLVEALRSLSGNPEVHLVGHFGPNADWQIPTMLSDTELPGGGLVLFPGRRIVSLYGNPTTRFLGVLGEQGAEEAAERARQVAEPYGADGLPVLPGFEIIATVASVGAGGDGDYSSEMAVETLRPWVDLAGREGIYVTLDLQPGRTDFLTQARLYEELLLLPHVGLALDPEWRLKPNQVHLKQIGSVDAAEVNQVADWLAALVRENHLPQKLFIVHQFKLTMITNRALIERPPELAVMIHADGQGPIATKYATYAALTGPEDSALWWWGWKNFYDEDSPTPTPEQVLELDPLPVYVSYQ